MSRRYRLQRAQLLPRPRAEVFEFFANAKNLEAITPSFLHFEILTPGPIDLGSGTLIDYRLALFGFPLRWQTRIESFDPPAGFTDAQVKGPYRQWRHRHDFYEVSQGTLMVDTVDYEIPWGLLGRLARLVFVEKTLDRIFDYRGQRVAALLGLPPAESIILASIAP